MGHNKQQHDIYSDVQQLKYLYGKLTDCFRKTAIQYRNAAIPRDRLAEKNRTDIKLLSKKLKGFDQSEYTTLKQFNYLTGSISRVSNRLKTFESHSEKSYVTKTEFQTFQNEMRALLEEKNNQHKIEIDLYKNQIQILQQEISALKEISTEISRSIPVSSSSSSADSGVEEKSSSSTTAFLPKTPRRRRRKRKNATTSIPIPISSSSSSTNLASSSTPVFSSSSSINLTSLSSIKTQQHSSAYTRDTYPNPFLPKYKKNPEWRQEKNYRERKKATPPSNNDPHYHHHDPDPYSWRRRDTFSSLQPFWINPTQPFHPFNPFEVCSLGFYCCPYQI